MKSQDEVEMTTEQLDLVTGGLLNCQTDAWAYVKDGMISGFTGAGGVVNGEPGGPHTWISGGKTVHF